MQGRSPIVHGDGLQARDFTFVENNVRANILAATANFEAKGQPYNIACGESYNLLQLLGQINKTFGTHIKPEHTSPRVGDIRISKAGITRAQRDFGYKVTVPFEKGLARTIEWYRGVSAR
jgi:nucleoside-diphosphate-sugar epimerase